MTSATPTRFRFATLLSHRIVDWLKAIERPAAFKNKRRNLGVSHFGKGFHDTVSASDFQRVQETSVKQLCDSNLLAHEHFIRKKE